MTELNSCDKCGEHEISEELIWMIPKEWEMIPLEVFAKYEKLCKECYEKEVEMV